MTAPSDLLRFDLEGAPDDGGRVRLDALEDFLDQVQRTLSAVEREITGKIRTNTVYTVAEVSLRRRLRLGVRGRPAKLDIPYVGDTVFPRLKSEAHDISRGVEPPNIDTDTLETFAGFEATRKRGLHKIRLIDTDGIKPISLDEKFDTKVRTLLGNVYRSVGSFRGRLEAVNLHTNPSSVYIYPIIGPSKVRCTFVKGSFPNIGEYLDRDIEVFGTLKFRENEPHPFAIEVENIMPMFGDIKRPPATALLGLMPDLISGMSTMDYLEDIRHEATT